MRIGKVDLSQHDLDPAAVGAPGNRECLRVDSRHCGHFVPVREPDEHDSADRPNLSASHLASLRIPLERCDARYFTEWQAKRRRAWFERLRSAYGARNRGGSPAKSGYPGQRSPRMSLRSSRLPLLLRTKGASWRAPRPAPAPRAWPRRSAGARGRRARSRSRRRHSRGRPSRPSGRCGRRRSRGAR